MDSDFIPLIHLCDAIQVFTRQRSNSNTIIAEGEGGIPQSSEHKAQSTITNHAATYDRILDT